MYYFEKELKKMKSNFKDILSSILVNEDLEPTTAEEYEKMPMFTKFIDAIKAFTEKK